MTYNEGKEEKQEQPNIFLFRVLRSSFVSKKSLGNEHLFYHYEENEYEEWEKWEEFIKN